MARCYLCSTNKGKAALEETAVLRQTPERFEEIRLARCQQCLDDIHLLQKGTTAAGLVSVAAWLLVLIPLAMVLVTVSVLTLGNAGYLVGIVLGLAVASRLSGLLRRLLARINRNRLREKLHFPKRAPVDVEKLPAVVKKLGQGWVLAGRPLTSELPKFYQELKEG